MLHEQSPAAGIAAALGARAEAVCRRYLPHGRKLGRYWVAGDLDGARGRSLFVRLSGSGTPGKWTDAATGEHGDLLDLIRHRTRAPSLRAALDEARTFLALPVSPSTATSGEYDATEAAAPVWVAMEYRFMPPVARLLDKVRAGDAGTPRMIAIREHRFPFLEKVGHWNRFNARTGGTLVEKCCHFRDLMRLTLGADPVRVYASAGRDVNHPDECYRGRQPDIVDNAFVIVDFEGGARGMLDLCMFAEGSYWQESISVTGDVARIEARVPGPARFSASGEERAAEVSVADRGRRTETRTEIDVEHRILRAGDHHGATYFQHERFRRLAAAGSGEAEVSPTDRYWSVLMGEAAEESARTGVPVDLNGRGP